jgi:hypothetical protein
MLPELPSIGMTAVTAIFATAVDDQLPKLLLIPAGWGIGQWLAVLAAFITNQTDDTRAFLKDFVGTVGGAIGFAIFLVSFIDALGR